MIIHNTHTLISINHKCFTKYYTVLKHYVIELVLIQHYGVYGNIILFVKIMFYNKQQNLNNFLLAMQYVIP